MPSKKFNQNKYQNALNWIESFWPTLIVDHPKMEESLISVPHSYIVPGGMFDEFYYWDTYFAMLGLAHEKNKALLEGIVENFLYLFQKYNVIPNGNRTFYLNRSQPPFLALMIDLVYKINHDKLWLLRAYEVAKKEYQLVWCGDHKTQNGLSRYCHSAHLKIVNDKPLWEGKNENEKNTPLDLHHLAVCESGWDYTPRFEEDCPVHNPVDLNCLLFEYENLFIKFCIDLHLKEDQTLWIERNKVRQKLINQHLWNKEQGFYFDFNFDTQAQSKIWSAAGFFPLFVNAASKEQAEVIIKNLNKFETNYGILTCDQAYGHTEDQWNYPYGWPPLQWVVIQGLKNYGYIDEAKRITDKWLDLCNSVFEKTGQFWERYDVIRGTVPTGGRYPAQHGFAWTNGIFSKLATF